MKHSSGLTFKELLDSTLNPGDDEDDGLKIWDYVLVHGGVHIPMGKSDLEEAKEEADDQKKLLQKSTPCVRPIRKGRRL